MPPAVNIDLKVSFELYDMEPGAKGRQFIRNLLLHGGRSDARGFSFADTFLRQDEGGIAGVAFIGGLPGPGGAAPGAVGLPVAPAQRTIAIQFRRARVKNGFEFITRHLSDEATLTLLGDNTNPLFQDGPETFDFIRAQVVVTPDTAEIQDMNIEWYQIEFMNTAEIGSSQNTIKDALKILRLRNAERPLPYGELVTADSATAASSSSDETKLSSSSSEVPPPAAGTGTASPSISSSALGPPPGEVGVATVASSAIERDCQRPRCVPAHK